VGDPATDQQSEQDFRAIEKGIEPFLVGNRTKSAALLAWFLHAIWRLDPEDVDDAMCDGSGDKGIDGLVVDDDLSEITIFQSKHRLSPFAGQGDSDLKRLAGASTSAAMAVGNQRASTIPTEPMTRTATAEPTCMESAMTTTSSAAVPAPRRDEGGPAGSSAVA